MPEKYVRRDGLPLLVRHTGATTLPEAPPRLGDAPTILCLHDAGLQSSVFSDLLGDLEPRLGDAGAALAFDLPGHGRSGSLDALPSIAAMAEMTGWLVDRCEIEKTLLVGHGMGALVALEIARSRPDAVAGLVLCGAGLALGIADETIDTMRLVTQGKAPRPFDPTRIAKASGQEKMRRAYMEGIRTDPRATLVDLEASRAWADAFAKDPSGVSQPVHFLVGEAESDDARARAESLAKALAQGRTLPIADCAHFLPLEQPVRLADEILATREGA